MLTEGPETALQYLTIYIFIVIINIVVVFVITTTTTTIIIIIICPLPDPPTSPSLMNKFIINIVIVATITNYQFIPLLLLFVIFLTLQLSPHFWRIQFITIIIII